MATTFIKTSDIKDIMTIAKRNLGGFSNPDFLQWANFLNQEARYALVNINPNDYLLRYTFKKDSGILTFDLPTDFESLTYGGIHKTLTGTSLAALNYDALGTQLTIGQVVTGTTSGAYGTIIGDTFKTGDTSGTLELNTLSTVSFQDNESITDPLGGSGTANGDEKRFKYIDDKISETRFGSKLKGYWLDSQINITGYDNNEEVFVMRYLDILDQLTDVSDDTVIPIAYEEAVKNATDVYWEETRRDSNREFLASQRFRQTVRDMFKNIRKTPNLLFLPNKTRVYRNRNVSESTIFSSQV